MHSLKKVHLQPVLRILQYLKGTPRKEILFKRHDGFNAGSIIERRSTLEYWIFLEGNLATWSRKKSVVARSSAMQNLD